MLGIAQPGTLPAPELVGLLAEWSFVPVFSGLGFMLVLFPSGTLPSPRWRPFAALALLATALAMAGFVVHPRLIALPAPGGVSLTFANPLGIDSLGPVLSTVLIGTLNGLGALATVLLAAAFVSLVVRYRSGGRVVRQQIKWITLAAVALADVAQDMAGQLDADVALDRMASVLAGATGAVRVDVWVRVGARLQPRAAWPPGSDLPAAVPLTGPVAATGPVPLTRPVAATGPVALPAFDAATRAIAVRHWEELLGAITLQKPRNEPVSPAEDKLLEHLASQAGLVLRNVRLTAELQATIDDLRASRRRLVKAQDNERQRIERNLHDGARQQLVALTVQLTLLEDAAQDLGEVTQLAGELRAGLRAALDDLRALARGIYPPLLADQGLTAALHAQAGKAPLPVEIKADGIGRYPREAEAAVYFCILEALQNVAKYAQASRATVVLTCPDGQLGFTVTDDGDGFDTAKATHGTGLQGMADRLAAVGGTLRVNSAPGLGTTVSGTLPVAEPAAAARRPAAEPAVNTGMRR